MRQFQSTLPHGERRKGSSPLCSLSRISIHAPTRGATVMVIDYSQIFLFQSTLPHGERQSLSLPILTHRYFNPRSHTGSDIYPCTGLFVIVISIHAPTRGATCFGLNNHRAAVISIHAPTRGATHLPRIRRRPGTISIHAPTRGATAILYKNFAYFHSYVTIINIHCISMHPFADA